MTTMRVEQPERVYRSPEPFTLPGYGPNGNVLLLMVHGFTGSPSEFRRLGYFLNDMGYSVEALQLPGHGTRPEDMIKTRWPDWWSHVRDTHDRLMDNGFQKVVAIGHSMGGLLSLMLAVERQLHAVVSLSTPIYIHARTPVLAPFLQYMIRYVSKRPSNDFKRLESCSYDRTPVPCVVSLQRLLRRVKGLLGQVSAPLFIAQGGRDATVHRRSADYLYRSVTSPAKEIKYYPDGSHSLLLDEERDRVYADIYDFLQKV